MKLEVWTVRCKLIVVGWVQIGSSARVSVSLTRKGATRKLKRMLEQQFPPDS